MDDLRPFGPRQGGPTKSQCLFVRGDDHRWIYRAMRPWQLPILSFDEHRQFLPPFEETDLTLDIASHVCPVIRVRRMPFQIRIQEMTRRRALECVRFLTRFVAHCTPCGVVPMDIHEGNFLWWDRPYFVDFDALHPLDANAAATAFVRIGYLLYRYVSGIALPDHDSFDIIQLQNLEGWMGRQADRDFTDVSVWRELESVLSAMRIEAPSSHWSEGYATDPDAIENSDKFIQLRKMAPKGRTMLDVACNSGYCGELLKDRYEAILGFDSDERCIDDARRLGPGINFAHCSVEHLMEEWPTHPIVGRFRADVVLALAITHHLDAAEISARAFSGLLCDLALEWILIEDIANVEVYDSDFTRRGFRLTDRRPSFPANRTLSLWKRT